MSVKKVVETIRFDSCIEDADWIKKSWDLPPYMSPDFLAIISLERLDAFRETVTYKSAVANGVIHEE